MDFGQLNLIFATCECVQRFTNAFSDINDAIDQSDWYVYPKGNVICIR